MTDESPTVPRRGLLRAGAVVAGATAGAALTSVTAAPRADAATGDAMVVGAANTARNHATTITVTASTTVPALKLVNATGPSLNLAPVTGEVTDSLATGSIVNTVEGPLIGVADGGGSSYTTYLVTGADLAMMALPVAINPSRVLDTRNTAGRAAIVATSAGALDAAHRLKGGSWIDVAIDSAGDDFTLDAAFVNVTVTGSPAGGYVSLYEPGPRPDASTLNFAKGQTIANGAFVPLGVVAGQFAVRLYASATTHVLLDLSGVMVAAVPGPAAVAATAARETRMSARTRPAARPARVLGRARRR